VTSLRELEALTVEECFELIRHQPIGRVAISSMKSPPLVVPVTFVVDGVSVVFRSDVGEKIEAVGQRVSFQVDSMDALHQTGWSVLLQGTLTIARAAEVAHLRLEPWVGSRTLWLRIVPDTASGRRLSLNLPETDERGYR
jgi:nitroimidazol reductase NimA-like FMN-containing flavoprotein (pyridoxamine 5'-phosphate oxidase superfamily)